LDGSKRKTCRDRLRTRRDGAIGSTGGSPAREGSALNQPIPAMLHWTLVFLIVALIAAVFGFTGIAGTAAHIAKILFVIFLVLWLISFLFR